MTTPPTLSEQLFEEWCRDRGIECHRVPEARAQGHKRPDYAIKVQQYWCFVEIKQIDPTPDDEALLQDALSGMPKSRWFVPGVRPRQPIKKASDQLRKFSQRGFPTVVCLLDTTVGFHLEQINIIQAMFGQESLRFEVSEAPCHKPLYLGSRFKKATLTPGSNTSISAVAVLRRPCGSKPVIDLYHNPHPRVRIPRHLAAPLVQRQYPMDPATPNTRVSSSLYDFIFGSMPSAEREEWFNDPDGKFRRELEKGIREGVESASRAGLCD
ncbi:MAG: hypothetical protein ACREC0_04390 [Methylocella sp.]